MNDNILEVNDKTLQEHDFIEWQKAIMSKHAKRVSVFVIIAAVVIYTAAVVSWFLKISIVDLPVLITITVCLLITLFIRFFWPKVLGKMRYKQYNAAHNSRGRMVFYTDHSY